MSWTLYRWVWQLRSPLHIGHTPAGALNRTRLYIPARNMWAALTAEIARQLSPSSFPDYQQIGQSLQAHVRFSYLFPAEKVDGRWCAWLPRYEQRKGGGGLFWHREDGNVDPVPDRQFRQRLLDTRSGTAIAPGSGTAEEGSLREFEYVMPYWRPKDGQSEPQPVAFVGYVFLKDPASQAEKEKEDKEILKRAREIRELFIGGEIRYGFGRLTLIPFSEQEPWEPTKQCFGYNVNWGNDRNDNAVSIQSPEYLLAHSLDADVAAGDREVLFGWDWQTPRHLNGLHWMPGTSLKASQSYMIDEVGRWVKLPR